MFTIFFAIMYAKKSVAEKKYLYEQISVLKQNASRPVTLNELKLSSLPYNKQIIKLAKSVLYGRGRVYRPHCVRSILTTSVMFLL